MALRRSTASRAPTPATELPFLELPAHVQEIRNNQQILKARIDEAWEKIHQITFARLQPYQSQEADLQHAAELREWTAQRQEWQNAMGELQRQEHEWIAQEGGPLIATIMGHYIAHLRRYRELLHEAHQQQTWLLEVCKHGQRELRGQCPTPTAHLLPANLEGAVHQIDHWLAQHSKGDDA
jgi:hypothetical protein